MEDPDDEVSKKETAHHEDKTPGVERRRKSQSSTRVSNFRTYARACVVLLGVTWHVTWNVNMVNVNMVGKKLVLEESQVQCLELPA